MTRAKQSFLKFLSNTSLFSAEEKFQIQASLEDKHIFLVFRLATLLLGWSFVMLFVDIFLVSGLVVYVLMHHMSMAILLLPAGLFVLNIILKFLVLRHISQGRIPVWILFVSTLPYAGSAFLIAHTLSTNTLFRKALLAYLKHKRKSLMKY